MAHPVFVILFFVCSFTFFHFRLLLLFLLLFSFNVTLYAQVVISMPMFLFYFGRCLCRPGYEQSLNDSKQCNDINECDEVFFVCSSTTELIRYRDLKSCFFVC